MSKLLQDSNNLNIITNLHNSSHLLDELLWSGHLAIRLTTEISAVAVNIRWGRIIMKMAKYSITKRCGTADDTGMSCCDEMPHYGVPICRLCVSVKVILQSPVSERFTVLTYICILYWCCLVTVNKVR